MLISRKAFRAALEDERRKADEDWIDRNNRRYDQEYNERRFASLEERIRKLEKIADITVETVDEALCYPNKI